MWEIAPTQYGQVVIILKFRKDINFLRALAVVSVVVFHFSPSVLSGGFAGVDVFFVISGFLMTKIISDRILHSEFSLLQFYIDRARRIIPALFVLCTSLLVLGWFFFTPLDYSELSLQISYALTFFSNLLFWSQGGYFESASHEKILLHTWSLSVEWQFYLIYPIFFMLLSRYLTERRVLFGLIITTLCGYGLSIYMSQKSPSAAYFLLPTRFWEMTLGGIAVFINRPFRNSMNSFFVAAFGACLILLSMLFISQENQWPGYLAIIPTFGTFLILICNLDLKLYGLKVFELLGRWSYSIYLWHWPIVVFLYFFESLKGLYILVGILFSIVLGWCSYTYIEQSYIKKKLSIKGAAFIPSCLFISIFFIAFYIYAFDGLVNRADDKVMAASKGMDDKPPSYSLCSFTNSELGQLNVCNFSNDTFKVKRLEETTTPSVIVIGDSHSSSLIYSVIDSAKKFDVSNLIFMSHPACLSIPGAKVNGNEKYTLSCNVFSKNIQLLLNNYPNVPVIMAHRLPLYFYGYNEKETLNDINLFSDFESINKHSKALELIYKDYILELAEGRALYLLSPVPEQVVNVPKYTSRRLMLGLYSFKGINYEDYIRRIGNIPSLLDSIVVKNPNVTILKPHEILCNKSLCISEVGGKPLYYDDDHLSLTGADYINEIFDIIWKE